MSADAVAWLEQRFDEVCATIDPDDRGVVPRQMLAVGATYVEQAVSSEAEGVEAALAAIEGAEFQQVASENPQVEYGQPGWLGRAFGRLFGRGAA